jgi:hypothetical protein
MYGLTSGDPIQEVRQKLGRPDIVQRHSRLVVSGEANRYVYRRLGLAVYTVPPRPWAKEEWAFGFRTTSHCERLRNGIGVGTAERALRRAMPWLRCESGWRGRGCMGDARNGIEFSILDGKVRAVTVLVYLGAVLTLCTANAVRVAVRDEAPRASLAVNHSTGGYRTTRRASRSDTETDRRELHDDGA